MATVFSACFLAMLALTLALRLWLFLRQIRHVSANRASVPPAFAARIPLTDHQKAAEYTVAKLRLSIVELAADTLLLLLLTFGGWLAGIDRFWRDFFPERGIAYGLALFASVGLISFFVGLPFTLRRTFRIEAAFGFNKMTPALFVSDLAKQLLLLLLIGAPLLAVVLWLMQTLARDWWLAVWAVWFIFNLLAMLIYPTFIAPLFNKFTPLADGEVKRRVEALLTRCGFASAGLFVMDGSKRSAHGNAYFTGFGQAKRIVFYDTLIEKLTPVEVEAVLAHELGHYRHRHIQKRLAMIAVLSLALLWLLGQLVDQPWFYAGLGIPEATKIGAGETARNPALALVLFSLVLPVFTFPLTPLFSSLSRRHEFAADAFAAQQADAGALIDALVKLYRDNAATLTPDPLYSLFHDSHPPAAERIAHLQLSRGKESFAC